ncbi:hypothetical protein DEO72_LG5g1369 [Vigna unguiculata]|uniref:Uncharacterized protein n=1 Tax=Vigna unguiculata TaxID=3917 RepID=A0A4D6LZ99_VIGUN|nr:hypothetical protein DEO72_LG5g1369 [Vigna unguiculata]
MEARQRWLWTVDGAFRGEKTRMLRCRRRRILHSRFESLTWYMASVQFLTKVYYNRGRKVDSASVIEGTDVEKLVEIAKMSLRHYMFRFLDN